MKKVGIMSMQRIYNYGSFLQGYALKKLIENLGSDIQVSFVDYTPGKPLVVTESTEPTGIKRNIAKLREYNNVQTSLKNKFKFFNHKRTYEKRFFSLLGITDEKNINPELDVLVIGSDEVFNCVQSNTNVGYTRDLFGHNSRAKKIISYAGSFGNTTFNKIKAYKIFGELTDDIAKFDYVSVRDANSVEIMKDLGVDNPYLHIDPVLAYDYMELETSVPRSRLYNEEYMIVYGYSGRFNTSENSILKDYAKKKNLKILCIGGVQDCCDEFIDCTPFELLAYFRDAEAVVTDTFHGTIFSIINKKPFVTIVRASIDSHYGNEEKLGFLLELFSLTDKRIDKMTINNLEDKLNVSINYDNVFDILTKNREEAQRYLKNTIN